ncbi:hypothetical protein F4802DRAFT_241299 [Xylaria palmicola]|nr:hypothetical protein F4802DRAFT_241299 [Xylaria palmicola]
MDWGRPCCRACQSKKRYCFYDCENGQSRLAALQSRVQALEQQVHQSQLPVDTEAQTQRRPLPDTPSLISSNNQLLTTAHQEPMPSASVTQEAIDAFFNWSGKLFHIFTRPQVSLFADSAWKSSDNTAGSQHIDTSDDTISPNVFYSIAKVYLDAILETRPLDAIKVCALLGIYNFMDKTMASLAFVDIGLGLCRRFKLDSQERQLSTLTDLMWVDYHEASHTLMFLSTWLSATLGYRSSNEDLFYRLFPSELRVEYSSDISKVVQREMACIAVLQAKIIHMPIPHDDLSLTIESVARDLDTCYAGLHQLMRIREVASQNLPPEVRRSIYLVHLLYLGADMLLFRRIACMTIRPANKQGGLLIPQQPSREQYLKQENRALLAARGSARIVQIMMDEHSVSKRCCLVNFQINTTCLILLHAVLGKIVLNTQPPIYEEDLDSIRSCLSALFFCSSRDPVAARFHNTLFSVYKILVNNHVNQPTCTSNQMPTMGDHRRPTVSQMMHPNMVHGSEYQGKRVLNSYPDGEFSYHTEPSLENLSTNLLDMLCWPFSNQNSRVDSRETQEQSCDTASDQNEVQCQMETSEWDFEDSASFQWNADMLEMVDDGTGELNPNSTISNGESGVSNSSIDSAIPNTQNGSLC